MKRLRYKKGRLSDLIQNFYFYAMPIACRASYRQMNFVNTVVVTQDVIAWRLTNYFEYASNLPESVANVVGVFSDANCNEHCTTLCRYPLMREKCFGGEHSRATNSGRVLIAKRLRREGLLLHSPQNIPLRAPA